MEPTVFTHVTNDMIIAREENFGPALSIISYDSVDERQDRQRQQVRVGRRRLEFGRSTVWINDWHNISQFLPFGGCKQSGVGRELGPPPPL